MSRAFKLTLLLQEYAVFSDGDKAGSCHVPGGFDYLCSHVVDEDFLLNDSKEDKGELFLKPLIKKLKETL